MDMFTGYPLYIRLLAGLAYVLMVPSVLLLLVRRVTGMKNALTTWAPLALILGLALFFLVSRMQTDYAYSIRSAQRAEFKAMLEHCKPLINFDAPAVGDDFKLDGKVIVSEGSNSRQGMSPGMSVNYGAEWPTPYESFALKPFTARHQEEVAAVVLLRIQHLYVGTYGDTANSMPASDTVLTACLINPREDKVLGVKKIIGKAPDSVTTRKGFTSGPTNGLGPAMQALAEWLGSVTGTAGR